MSALSLGMYWISAASRSSVRMKTMLGFFPPGCAVWVPSGAPVLVAAPSGVLVRAPSGVRVARGPRWVASAVAGLVAVSAGTCVGAAVPAAGGLTEPGSVRQEMSRPKTSAVLTSRSQGVIVTSSMLLILLRRAHVDVITL